MKRYYIYHIPGIKIGCTSELEVRMQTQGFTEWEILEEHTNIYEVSDREIELQKEYGYRVDTLPYWKAVENRLKGQRKANNGWQSGDQVARGKKNKGRKRKDLTNINKTQKRFLTYNQAEEIRSKWIPKTYGLRQKLADEYGVSGGVIHRIVNNLSYTTS